MVENRILYVFGKDLIRDFPSKFHVRWCFYSTTQIHHNLFYQQVPLAIFHAEFIFIPCENIMQSVGMKKSCIRDEKKSHLHVIPWLYHRRKMLYFIWYTFSCSMTSSSSAGYFQCCRRNNIFCDVAVNKAPMKIYISSASFHFHCFTITAICKETNKNIPFCTIFFHSYFQKDVLNVYCYLSFYSVC